MRKYLFLLVMSLAFTITVDAKVVNHLIDAEIEIAGGLNIKELIVIDNNEKDLSRTINYKMLNEAWKKQEIDFKSSPIYNGYSIENLKVSAFAFNGEIDFNAFGSDIKEYFDELNPQSKNENFYTSVKNDLGYTVNIHYEHQNKEFTVYYLEYLVSNVIVVHEDIAELNYTFKNLKLNADNTLIRVIIPYPTESELYNVWLHGPSSGKMNELVNSNDEKVGIISEFASINSEVNVRMTLPKEQVGVDLYLNHSNQEALKEILNVEKSRLNNNDKILEIIKYTLIILCTLYVIGSLLIFKYHHNTIVYLYITLGIILSLFNLVFKYHIIYLYFIILAPLIVKVITLFKAEK